MIEVTRSLILTSSAFSTIFHDWMKSNLRILCHFEGGILRSSDGIEQMHSAKVGAEDNELQVRYPSERQTHKKRDRHQWTRGLTMNENTQNDPTHLPSHNKRRGNAILQYVGNAAAENVKARNYNLRRANLPLRRMYLSCGCGKSNDNSR